MTAADIVSLSLPYVESLSPFFLIIMVLATSERIATLFYVVLDVYRRRR